MKTNFEDNVKNPQLRALLKEKMQFQGLTATAVAIPQNRLVEISSNKIQLGTDDDANIIGANLSGAIGASGTGDIDYGAVEVLASGDFAVLDRVACAASGRVRKYLATQGTILAETAGGNITQQAGTESITVVSDSAADVTQTVTLYFTKTGATTTVSSETLTLTGTDAVETTSDAIITLLAVVVSAAHAGTITVAMGTTTTTICTLATGTNSLGYTATTAPDAYGTIPTTKAGAASTKKVGVLGVSVDGVAQTAVVSLNGTTDVDLGALPFDTVTYMLHADVASASTSIIETKVADTNAIGIAAEAGTSGSIAKIYMRPFGI